MVYPLCMIVLFTVYASTQVHKSTDEGGPLTTSVELVECICAAVSQLIVRSVDYLPDSENLNLKFSIVLVFDRGSYPL